MQVPKKINLSQFQINQDKSHTNGIVNKITNPNIYFLIKKCFFKGLSFSFKKFELTDLFKLFMTYTKQCLANFSNKSFSENFLCSLFLYLVIDFSSQGHIVLHNKKKNLFRKALFGKPK